MSLFFILTLTGLFVYGINALAVGDAYFPQDTTIDLSGTSYTIAGGSDADEITTSGGIITIKISDGHKFTFKSSDRKILTNDGGFKYSCSSAESSVIIEFPGTTTQRTVTITPDSSTCSNLSGGGGGGGGGGGVISSSSTPTPISTPAPVTSRPTPEQHGLKDGDVVGAVNSSDPDIYIVNVFGFKRLFLNPVIFSFYGHLGGFTKVKTVNPTVRDVFTTSGLFRNCETNDLKVYGVEITGEDTGTLHWVNTSGAQAVADDADFFKKVFCINSNEFNWYKQGTPYTSVRQIPAYSRKTAISIPVVPASATTAGKLKVVSSVLWLNVRDQASTNGKILGKVLPDQQFNFVDLKDGWYKIQKDGKDFGWVFGKYVTEL